MYKLAFLFFFLPSSSWFHDRVECAFERIVHAGWYAVQSGRGKRVVARRRLRNFVTCTEIIPRGEKWRESWLYFSNSVLSHPVDGHVLLVVVWLVGWLVGARWFEGVVGDTRPIKDEWYPANVCEYVRERLDQIGRHTLFSGTLCISSSLVLGDIMEVHAHHYSAIASRMNQMKCFTGDKIVRLCSLFFWSYQLYDPSFLCNYMRFPCTGCASFFFLFRLCKSFDSVSSMILFSIRVEIYLYEDYFSYMKLY